MSGAMMRFAGVSLSHDPKNLKLTKKKKLSSKRLLSGRQTLETSEQIIGVSGRGELCGKSCMEDLYKLLRLSKSCEADVLSMPYLGAIRAVLTDISLAGEPRADYIAVDFVFERAPDTAHPEIMCAPVYEVTNSGENLWDIAYRFGKDINELVRINTHIRHIENIAQGERVRLY